MSVIRRLVDEREAAKALSLSQRTLQRQRQEGGGFPFVRVGKRRIAYDLDVLEAEIHSRTFKSAAAEMARNSN